MSTNTPEPKNITATVTKKDSKYVGASMTPLVDTDGFYVASLQNLSATYVRVPTMRELLILCDAGFYAHMKTVGHPDRARSLICRESLTVSY